MNVTHQHRVYIDKNEQPTPGGQKKSETSTPDGQETYENRIPGVQKTM